MEIELFGVERWMDTYEAKAVYNMGETCVSSLTLEELLTLSGKQDTFWKDLARLRLSYGHITGNPQLKEQIAHLYTSQGEKNVLVMNGGSGANFLALYTLVEPGMKVVSFVPSYQQHYAIPRSFGAEVSLLWLREEDGFLPSMEEFRKAVRGAKVITLCNPNNPTGSVVEQDLLEEMVSIAAQEDAWFVCDEVYRGLVHPKDLKVPSVADMYSKGISTGSLSKAYSLAGLRMGWIVGPQDFLGACELRRDYTTISCAQIDERLASMALKHGDAILERNLGLVRRGAELLEEWVVREKRARWVPPRGGTTAFIHLDYPKHSREICRELMEQRQVLLVPGECFGMEHWYRVGYAYSPEKLREGLEQLSFYLQELEG